MSSITTLIGRPGDAADSARDFLARNGVALRWIDLDRDPLGSMLPAEELEAASLPLAIFADGSRLEAPPTYRANGGARLRDTGASPSVAGLARRSGEWRRAAHPPWRRPL
jgi:hypothetical protein